MAVVHPRLEQWEFEALQERFGWAAPFEYLHGQAVVTPPIGGWEAASDAGILEAIFAWRATSRDGGLVLPDVFVLVGHDQLAPDLSYWTAERRPDVPRGRIDTVPDLVVEVASPSNQDNDEGPKRAAYLAAGVREQWLVDRRRIRLIGADGREAILQAQDVLTSAVLTGFTAPVRVLTGR